MGRKKERPRRALTVNAAYVFSAPLSLSHSFSLFGNPFFAFFVPSSTWVRFVLTEAGAVVVFMLFNFLNHFLLCFLLHFSLFSTAERTLQDSESLEKGRWQDRAKARRSEEEVEASKVGTHQNQCPLWGKMSSLTTNTNEKLQIFQIAAIWGNYVRLHVSLSVSSECLRV